MLKPTLASKLIVAAVLVALLGGAFAAPGAKAQSGGTNGNRSVAAVTVPTLVFPKGTVPISTLAYIWTPVPNAGQYQIQVALNSVVFLEYYYDTTVCAGDNCLARPGNILGDASYTWRMKAYVGGVWQTASAWQAFVVSTGNGTGFNSSFNTDHAGWNILKGTWIHESSAYFTTLGVPGKASTITYDAHFSTLTYEVRMKRAGMDACANAIIVRGDAVQDSGGWWNQEYTFNYTNTSGYGSPLFIITKDNNGVYTRLKDWTTTGAVLAGDWNTLKVTATGSSLKFYINNILVWSGSDSTFSSGHVGIGMYRNAVGTCDSKLLVDWAKLTTSVTSLSSASGTETVEQDQQEVGGGDHNVAP